MILCLYKIISVPHKSVTVTCSNQYITINDIDNDDLALATHSSVDNEIYNRFISVQYYYIFYLLFYIYNNKAEAFVCLNALISDSLPTGSD